MFNKRIIALSLILLHFIQLPAQDILGRWYAKTSDTEKEEHFLLDLRKDKDRYTGYLDLPSSNIFRVRFDSIRITNVHDSIYCSQKGLNIQFNGQFNKTKNIIAGVLHKDNITDTTSFTRTPQATRTQLIKEPIPYLSRDVFFYNKDSTRFAGTLTLPKEKKAISVVILVSGSGPQNRDEEILGHRPFKVLADHLTRKGIAVLRYDDRGYGESEGQFRPATWMDYADDAIGAIKFLKNHKDLNINKLGIIGHSEGGNIAPAVATLDSTVDFIVLLAAPGVSNLESYLVSLDLILKEYPETYDRDFPVFKSVYTDMATISDKKILTDSISKKFQRLASQMTEEEFSTYGSAADYVKAQTAYHTSNWYHHFLQFDVTPYLENLDLPILALNGDQDNSVESKVNLKGLEHTLKKTGNNNYKLVELENVNHFFQVSEDSKIQSVYFNEETFSKKALQIISDWIKELDSTVKSEDNK